ncbi:MAG: FKBP-type peptidyl-prolyl cis-trans isomerase [Phycisphaerales bacterium]|nr:FKBP-type peptidyl-prolyl cis-trans isomerase [Phycisphaerales bacterium]
MSIFQKKTDNNIQVGKSFLETNKTKAGVVVTGSGLQYEVLEQGQGDKPSAQHTVTCHYEGRLIDGTVFDSSIKRGQPASFPLRAVIKGWTEGLQLMNTGSKFRFYIPSELAYGDRDMATIPANSTLIFDVQLISFK